MPLAGSYIHSCRRKRRRRKATDAGRMIQQQLTANTPVTHISICLSLDVKARRAAMKSVGSHSYSTLKPTSITACINHSCRIQQLLFKSTALHDVSRQVVGDEYYLGCLTRGYHKVQQSTSCSTESMNRMPYDNTYTRASSCIQVVMQDRQHAMW